MQITATVVQLMDVVTGHSAKGEWKKQEMVVETKEQYPKKVCLTLWGDKVDSAPSVGQTKVFHLDISSREYNGRWFTEVKAWKIEDAEMASGGSSQEDLSFDNSQESDDLPW